MIRTRLVTLCSFVAVASVLVGLAAALPVAADPATSVRYPRSGATTTYSGLAFDACTAPTLSTMSAWRQSPFGAIGVYIGGVNRGCAQPQLTAPWVRSVARMGWRLLPIYMGRQAPCSTRADSTKIFPRRAAIQGRDAAANAVRRARGLGMRPGSAVYLDVEHYDVTRTACRDTVLEYVSAWSRGMHRRGYLAGVYAHQDSGALHLAQAFASRAYARPDALWIARWDGSTALSGWPTVPNRLWARAQRAKQFQGDHDETWGGVTINIDRDRLRAPVATVARTYRTTSAASSRVGPRRTSPVVRTFAAGARVPVVCQTEGPTVRGSAVWDKLAGGSYVPDARTSTPGGPGFTRALPRCRYAFQVRALAGAPVRSGPNSARPVVAALPSGALARVVCQRRGSTVGPTDVWDRLRDGRWVSDRHLATPSRTGFTRSIPRC